MKFTLSWLKDYLETSASLEEITHALTMLGLEVESITDKSAELAPFIVAEVLEAVPHPEADRLRVCKVNNGKEILTIVCGAPNARAGIKVALASIGVTIPTNGLKIKQSKIRGQESCGMLCSAAELGLGGNSEGIIELAADAPLGESIVPVLGLNDPVIEIAITPNRGDCLGVYGIARDLAAAGIGTLKPEGVTNEEFGNVLETGNFPCPVSVTIETPACSYFIGRSFKNVKNGESPAWLKTRLEAIGQKPISALVDITNYLTFAFGRPAHVYDAAKLKGNITVRETSNGESLAALDDKTYTISAGMTAIADSSGVIGLGGIIGGTSTKVDETTTDVFLEIALFDPIAIATTGRKLQINSDARYRFERGVSASTLKHFITATRLIQEICGGEASKPVVAGSIPMERRSVSFRPASVKARVGMDIAESSMQTILTNLGFTVEAAATSWKLGIPSYRPDVSIEEDIVEEIARIHGYANIPATPLPPVTSAATVITPLQRRLSETRRTLATRGLKECVMFSFIAKREAELFLTTNDQGLTTLSNPISADLNTMRPSVLPSLLSAAAKNAARGYADIALFELGSIFDGAEPAQQQPSAGGIRTGVAYATTPHATARPVDAFDAKADALAALEPFISATNIKVTREAPAYYHPGRSGALKLGNKVLGYFGELHPQVLQAMDIKTAVAAFETFPHAAPTPKTKASVARPKLELSPYQRVTRDFAFIVDAKTEAEALLTAVRKADKTLIAECSLFDVYQGKGVEEGKKSIALTITLQPKDKTLTDAEIEAVSSNVVRQVQQAVGGVLRG